MNKLEHKIYDELKDKIEEKITTGKGERVYQQLLNICHDLSEQYKKECTEGQYNSTKELRYILDNFDEAHNNYSTKHNK